MVERRVKKQVTVNINTRNPNLCRDLLAKVINALLYLQLKAFSACSDPSTAIINLSELILGGLMNALIPEIVK